MTLTTHAIVGAAMASLVPSNPALGFALGFASHFAIDSIPHWSEGEVLMRSMVHDPHNELKNDMIIGKDFMHDLFLLAGDALLGLGGALLILFYFFHVPFVIVVMGSVAGQLPDALQFVYYKTKASFMVPLQVFHSVIQDEFLNPQYLVLEAALIGAVIILGILGAFVL